MVTGSKGGPAASWGSLVVRKSLWPSSNIRYHEGEVQSRANTATACLLCSRHPTHEPKSIRKTYCHLTGPHGVRCSTFLCRRHQGRWGISHRCLQRLPAQSTGTGRTHSCPAHCTVDRHPTHRTRSPWSSYSCHLWIQHGTYTPHSGTPHDLRAESKKDNKRHWNKVGGYICRDIYADATCSSLLGFLKEPHSPRDPILTPTAYMWGLDHVMWSMHLCFWTISWTNITSYIGNA